MVTGQVDLTTALAEGTVTIDGDPADANLVGLAPVDAEFNIVLPSPPPTKTAPQHQPSEPAGALTARLAQALRLAKSTASDAAMHNQARYGSSTTPAQVALPHAAITRGTVQTVAMMSDTDANHSACIE